MSLSERVPATRARLTALLLSLTCFLANPAPAQTPAENNSNATQNLSTSVEPESPAALPLAAWSPTGVDTDWADISVMITLEDDFSPYAQSRYEWKTRGQSPMVALSRLHIAGWGRTSELALVPVDAYQAMLTQITDCVVGLPETSTAGDLHNRMTVSIRRGEQSFEGVVHTEPLEHPCLNGLLRLIEERLDLPPYRMPFWTEGEWGALQAGSDLPARLYVDGWDTGETTPLTGLRLTPGIHRVVWRSLQGDLDKELDVTIEGGRTTYVNVVLE